MKSFISILFFFVSFSAMAQNLQNRCEGCPTSDADYKNRAAQVIYMGNIRCYSDNIVNVCTFDVIAQKLHNDNNPKYYIKTFHTKMTNKPEFFKVVFIDATWVEIEPKKYWSEQLDITAEKLLPDNKE
jgi:hypothetical protein